MSVLGTRCGGGLPRAPREGAAPPSNPSKGGLCPLDPRTGGAWPHGTSRLLAYGKGGGLHPRQAALLRAARAGVAPRASRFLAYGKSGKHHTAARRKHAGVYGRPTLSARLAAGGSCPFLELVAGEASPAPPGRGLRPLPTPLRGALPPRPPNGGRCPPYPPLKDRDSAKSTGQNKATTRALKESIRTRVRRPKRRARRKVLCQAFFQESGGRLAGGGAGGVGEGGQFTGGVVHSPAEILRPLAVQLQNHRVSGEGFGAVVLADSLDFPV